MQYFRLYSEILVLKSLVFSVIQTHTQSEGNATRCRHLDCIQTKVSWFNSSLKFAAKTSSFPTVKMTPSH